MIRPLFIDGAWVETGAPFTVVDPGNGKTVAEVVSGGRGEARQALESASRALQGWRDLTGMQRGERLY